jgi:hypothetical protein
MNLINRFEVEVASSHAGLVCDDEQIKAQFLEEVEGLERVWKVFNVLSLCEIVLVEDNGPVAI